MPDSSAPEPPSDATSERLQELFDRRLSKLDALRQAGQEPYPARIDRDHSLAEARAAFEAAEQHESDSPTVTVAGRVTSVRGQGKVSFIDLRDGSGSLQLFCRRDALGESGGVALDQLDLGDHAECRGPLIRTRRGEISVEAQTLRVIAKAVRPPPEKFHGLRDQEARYRQRYLDLQANEDSREVFQRRSQIVAALRRRMDARGFLEMETPVLQSEAGGAAARPFETYFNALDEPRVLRIASELHLKRLIVGGFDKVYEVGRIFRNEGVSTRHNPEFTMMESYEAYADYGDVARMVEELVSGIAQDVLGTTVIPWGQPDSDNLVEIDLTPPWTRITMHEAVQQYAGVDFFDYATPEAMTELLRERHIDIREGAGWGKLFDAFVSATVEPQLIQPTFLLDYPIELSPLAKRHEEDGRLVERFEAFAAGWEVANAYSELNDPIDQRERFATQSGLREAGDEDVETGDEDFLVALEHGMPPTGGLGIGIDRLVMLLTNRQSIRDVILFPQLRRKI